MLLLACFSFSSSPFHNMIWTPAYTIKINIISPKNCVTQSIIFANSLIKSETSPHASVYTDEYEAFTKTSANFMTRNHTIAYQTVCFPFFAFSSSPFAVIIIKNARIPIRRKTNDAPNNNTSTIGVTKSCKKLWANHSSTSLSKSIATAEYESCITMIPITTRKIHFLNFSTSSSVFETKRILNTSDKRIIVDKAKTRFFPSFATFSKKSRAHLPPTSFTTLKPPQKLSRSSVSCSLSVEASKSWRLSTAEIGTIPTQKVIIEHMRIHKIFKSVFIIIILYHQVLFKGVPLFPYQRISFYAHISYASILS